MVKYDFDSLIKQLSDEDPDVRRHAALRLMWLEDDRAVEPLLKLLDDESPCVRACAALAIGHYEPKQALQPLLSLLEKDSSDDVRAHCIIALGSIGGDEALNGIIPYISDLKQPCTRSRMWSIFSKYGSQSCKQDNGTAK